jgi:four helix bundle protein
MKSNDISGRLIDFSVAVITLVEKLPKTTVGKHIGSQLLRSGTSAGANYEEARGAESKADFIHKLGIALKELRETNYWLKILKQSKVITTNNLEEIYSEADELCKIIGQSVVTAKRNNLKK